jgi:hypothetical protein
MSRNLANLNKRLAKLEQGQSERARSEELENCNCPALKSEVSFLAVWSEAFEAEMNKTCPVHGLRRFGPIVMLSFANPDGTESEDTMKLAQLIDSHERRLAQYSHSSAEPEEENDTQEP